MLFSEGELWVFQLVKQLPEVPGFVVHQQEHLLTARSHDNVSQLCGKQIGWYVGNRPQNLDLPDHLF